MIGIVSIKGQGYVPEPVFRDESEMMDVSQEEMDHADLYRSARIVSFIPLPSTPLEAINALIAILSESRDLEYITKPELYRDLLTKLNATKKEIERGEPGYPRAVERLREFCRALHVLGGWSGIDPYPFGHDDNQSGLPGQGGPNGGGNGNPFGGFPQGRCPQNFGGGWENCEDHPVAGDIHHGPTPHRGILEVCRRMLYIDAVILINEISPNQNPPYHPFPNEHHGGR